MVPFKNAIATVYPVFQIAGSGGVLDNPTAAPAASVAVYFEESTPAEMQIVAGVELTQTAYIQCEVADAAAFSPNALVQVTLTGSTAVYATFSQVGEAEQHVVGLATDHVDVYLKRKQFPTGL